MGNIPLSEYLARTRKEQLKVRGKGRMLLLDLGRAFNFLPDTEKEISRGEWYRVAINFWKKDKKICTYSLYEFWQLNEKLTSPTNKSLIDPIAGNVTGKGCRNSGDAIGSLEYGRERGYSEEKDK